MVYILDCTMRDGGYYNDWDFSPEFVIDYLSLMSELGVTHVEMGFRFLKSQSHSGPWAYTPDSLIDIFLGHKALSIGVMANLGELINAQDSTLLRLFPKTSIVNFVRIACHFEELAHLPAVVQFLVNQGFQVGVNLMQVSERTEADLVEFGALVNRLPVDFAYVADSLGALTPSDTGKIISTLGAALKIPLGIHAHDNKGLALQNSLSAKDAGATMLDCTLAGMGRGAGNTRTEDLIAELVRLEEIPFNQDSFQPLNNFLNKHMAPLKTAHDWGPSLPYRLAADWGIHPTFVQELLAEATDHQAVISSLQSLSSQDSSRFNPAMLESPGQKQSEEAPRFSGSLASFKGQPVLIVGRGPTALRHQPQVLHHAHAVGATILLLNLAWADHEGVHDAFRVGSNQMRLGVNSEKFWETKNATITPMSPPNKVQSNAENSVIPIQKSSGKIDFKDNVALVPNELTLSYALALSIYLEAPTVLIAGIDGYDEGDLRNSELIESLSAFKAGRPEIELVSLTPTRLPLITRSPYWRG
jgi:4-hydroxy 2-oxovalerate aldolase